MSFDELNYAPWELSPLGEPLPPTVPQELAGNVLPARLLHFRHDWLGHRYSVPVVGFPIGGAISATPVPSTAPGPPPPPPPAPHGVGDVAAYTAARVSGPGGLGGPSESSIPTVPGFTSALGGSLTIGDLTALASQVGPSGSSLRPEAPTISPLLLNRAQPQGFQPAPTTYPGPQPSPQQVPDSLRPIEPQPSDVPHVDMTKPCPGCGPARFPGPQGEPTGVPPISPPSTFPGPQGEPTGTSPLDLKLRLQRDITREQQQLETQRGQEEQQQIQQFEESETQQQTSQQIDESIRQKLALLDQLNAQIAQTQQGQSLQTTLSENEQITPTVPSQDQSSALDTISQYLETVADRGNQQIAHAGKHFISRILQDLGFSEQTSDSLAEKAWTLTPPGLIAKLNNLLQGTPTAQPASKPVQFCITCETAEEALKYQSGQGTSGCYLVEGSYQSGT